VVSISFVVEKSSVDAAIAMASAAVSPTSLAVFLATDAHETVIDRIDSRFKQEGDDASGPWAPLAYPTQVIRRSLGYGDMHPINVRTGAFLRWLQEGHPAIGIGRAGADYTYPGTAPHDRLTADKFTTSQQGGPKASTPARPALAVNETDLGLITTRLENWVKDRMGGYTV